VKSRTLLASYERQLIHRLPYSYGALVQKEIDQRLTAPLIDQVQMIPAYVINLFPILSSLLLIPFVMFYMLLDGPSGIDRFIQACPSRYVEQALHLLSEIDSSMGSYLRGIIIEAVAISLASFVGLLILDVNQALAISLLAGVCNFVPYLGAMLGGLVGGLVALFQFGNIWAFLRVATLFCIIRFADDWILQPLIAKQTVHLHALVFLMTLLIGGEFFGIAGLIFAVPVACVVKALFSVVWAWYSTEAQLRGPAFMDSSTLPYT
jgi:predicted PurR-regulated permease PerM